QRDLHQDQADHSLCAVRRRAAGRSSVRQVAAGSAVRLAVPPYRGGLAQADLALGDLLLCARRAQRDHLAQHLDRHLGPIQGVRLHAAHLSVRRAAISAAAEVRGGIGARRGITPSSFRIAAKRRVRNPYPRVLIAETGASGPTCWFCGETTAALRARRQRLVDLGLEHRAEIARGDRADELVGDAAVTVDDEGLRYAVDAPLDRGAAAHVEACRGERIAVAAEEAPGVLGFVL